jgi:hypothetical protein
MRWQFEHIRTKRGPFGVAYTCKVCGHAQVNKDKTSRAWGRILQHVTQEHSELRTVNKTRLTRRLELNSG